jgi:hypothetical protein
MAYICLWDRTSLEYDGLCSHCSLNEGIVGDFDLSHGELEAQAVQRKENTVSKQAVLRSNYHYQQMETNRDEYLEKKAEWNADYRARDPEKYEKLWRDNRAKHVENKTYHCEVCKLTFVTQADLNTHLKTPRHQQKAINLANDLATKRFKCLPCAFATDKKCRSDKHLKSKRHLKNVAAQSSSKLG